MKILKGSRHFTVISLAVLVVLVMPSFWTLADAQQPYSEWAGEYGGSEDDGGRSVQQTSDGGFIIAGSTQSFGAGGSDVYLVKTDSQGLEEWSSTFGGSSMESVFTR